MRSNLPNRIGFRGERIAEICLTSHTHDPGVGFRTASLGDKWPLLDQYVELDGVPGLRPYLFVQVKSTSAPLPPGATHLSIRLAKGHVLRLLQVPGPTYLLAVHEPTHRVFAWSIHDGVPVRTIQRIPLSNELTREGLRALHREVSDFWTRAFSKLQTSVFR